MSQTDEPRHRRRRRSTRPQARPRPVLKACLAGIGVALGAAVVLQAGVQTGRLVPTPADQVSEAWSILSAPAARRDTAEAERMAREVLAARGR